MTQDKYTAHAHHMQHDTILYAAIRHRADSRAQGRGENQVLKNTTRLKNFGKGTKIFEEGIDKKRTEKMEKMAANYEVLGD